MRSMFIKTVCHITAILCTMSSLLNAENKQTPRAIDGELRVGDLRFSILSPKQFAKVHGEGWVTLDGSNVNPSWLLANRFLAPQLPDARGIFLRGGKNNELPGAFLGEGLARHSHVSPASFNDNHGKTNQVRGHNFGNPSSTYRYQFGETGGANKGKVGPGLDDAEGTFPQNITLYLYVKVVSGLNPVEDSQVGEVVLSLLSEQDFQETHKGTWVKLVGQVVDKDWEISKYIRQAPDSTTLPDSRGRFIRGMMHFESESAYKSWQQRGESVPGDYDGFKQSREARLPGSFQSHAIQSHWHVEIAQYHGSNSGGTEGAKRGSDGHSQGATYNHNYANESRPNSVSIFVYLRVD